MGRIASLCLIREMSIFIKSFLLISLKRGIFNNAHVFQRRYFYALLVLVSHIYNSLCIPDGWRNTVLNSFTVKLISNIKVNPVIVAAQTKDIWIFSLPKKSKDVILIFQNRKVKSHRAQEDRKTRINVLNVVWTCETCGTSCLDKP